MRLLGINIKKVVIVTVISLLLSGCSFTKQLLWMDGDSGDKDTLPIRVKELIEMAQYCNEAYEKRPENYGVKKDEFSYTVKQVEGVTILVFRGTDNVKNIGTDIDMRFWKDNGLSEKWGDSDGGFYSKNVNLHRGFKDAAMFIESDLKKNYKLEKTVYLTGHSLGGAIAQIMGLWLDQEGYNVQIYTFGSPKISTHFFGNEPPHYRVVLDNDPVPFVPIYPYVHSGIRIDAATLAWDESDDYGDVFKVDARDHSIKEYLEILKEHND